MRAVSGEAQRGPILSATVLMGALATLTVGVVQGLPAFEVSIVVASVAILVGWHKTLLEWRNLLALLVLVILFVPIKKYTLPGALPFELELYRLLVAVVLLGWLISLLVDPRVRLRSSGFEGPIFLIVFAALGSVIVNPGRVTGLSSDVAKELTFFTSFLLVFWLIVAVLRSFGGAEFLVKVLAGGGTVVAAFALIEAKTGYNVFDHLASAIPILQVSNSGDVITRSGNLRVYASSQGPISLGAALVMLFPLAAYLARRTRRAWWWLAALILGLGSLATMSRTSVVMLLVLVLVFIWLRPSETKRMWPALLPVLIVVHFALPGTIGSMKASFFPEGGLIAQQSAHAGWRGSGRIADLSPAMDEFAQSPLLGQGFGTRITGRERTNAAILDNQWLKTLLETGFVGVLAWVWLYRRFVGRLGREAKRDRSDRGWLCAALAGSIASFAVGMFLFDAFSFIQATFLLFILMGIGAAVLNAPEPEGNPRAV